MADEVNDMLAQAFAEQINQQNTAEEETRKQQVGAQSQISDVRKALLEKLTQGPNSKQEIPEDVQQVVQILMAQPRFVEPTLKFLQLLVNRVNKAVEDVIEDVLDNPPTS